MFQGHGIKDQGHHYGNWLVISRTIKHFCIGSILEYNRNWHNQYFDMFQGHWIRGQGNQLWNG